MKKIFAWLLMFAVVFGFTSCSKTTKTISLKKESIEQILCSDATVEIKLVSLSGINNTEFKSLNKDKQTISIVLSIKNKTKTSVRPSVSVSVSNKTTLQECSGINILKNIIYPDDMRECTFIFEKPDLKDKNNMLKLSVKILDINNNTVSQLKNIKIKNIENIKIPDNIKAESTTNIFDKIASKATPSYGIPGVTIQTKKAS